MKFHRLMRAHVDEFVGASGGISEHFLRYKALKKQLKDLQQMEPSRGMPPHAVHATHLHQASLLPESGGAQPV